MDVELETTSTPTTSHSQRKERRKQRQPDNSPKRGLQKIQRSHGASSAPAAASTTAWVAPAHLLSHELPGTSTGSHVGVSAAPPRWPCLIHTDPTAAAALWDLSQVFWRKSKLSDVMDCFALALPTCRSCCFAGVFSWHSLPPSLPLPSLLLHVPGAKSHPNTPGAEQHLHHTTSSKGKQAAEQTGIPLPPRGIWKKEDEGAA